MNRHQSHKRNRKIKRTTKVNCIQLTTDNLELLLNALTVFEKVGEQSQKPLPNKEFALRMAQELKQKLTEALRLNEELSVLIAFNSNETTILSASLWLFMIEVKQMPACEEKGTTMQACTLLCSKFNPMPMNVWRELYE